MASFLIALQSHGTVPQYCQLPVRHPATMFSTVDTNRLDRRPNRIPLPLIHPRPKARHALSDRIPASPSGSTRKNGASNCARYSAPVGCPNSTLPRSPPRLDPGPCDQPPWFHGPSTIKTPAGSPALRKASYSACVPHISSWSQYPPTSSTGTAHMVEIALDRHILPEFRHSSAASETSSRSAGSPSPQPSPRRQSSHSAERSCRYLPSIPPLTSVFCFFQLLHIRRSRSVSRNAPLWKKSSPIHTSVIGACGLTAFTAGSALIPAIIARNPGYEIPSTPTLPSLFGTCFSSQSIVSRVSVDSSTLPAPRRVPPEDGSSQTAHPTRNGRGYPRTRRYIHS